MYKFLLTLSSLCFLILAACSSFSPDVSKLFQSTCEAPCWYEVVPGKTTKNELVELSPNFPYYDQDNISWRDSQYHYSRAIPSTSEANFYLDVANSWASVEIYLTNNIVQHTRIYSNWSSRGLRDLGFSLGDAITLYGEPEQIIVSLGCGGDSYCINLNLVYPTKGIIISVESPDTPSNLRLLPSLPVREIIYVSEIMLPETLSSFVDAFENCDIEDFTYPWTGYTTLDVNPSCPSP